MNNRGQALIETAVFFLVLSVLLGGLAGFTKWMSVRQKVLLAARDGALLYSSGHWERAVVEARIREYLIAGTPALSPEGIRVSVHPLRGANAFLWELDESVVEYTPPAGWHYLLGADPTVRERFVVKHAPHYWAPLQPKGGPGVPYGH